MRGSWTEATLLTPAVPSTAYGTGRQIDVRGCVFVFCCVSLFMCSSPCFCALRRLPKGLPHLKLRAVHSMTSQMTRASPWIVLSIIIDATWLSGANGRARE